MRVVMVPNRGMVMPMVMCSICGRPIVDDTNGIASYDLVGNELCDVEFTHKYECDRIRRATGKGKFWEKLDDFMSMLAHNMKKETYIE